MDIIGPRGEYKPWIVRSVAFPVTEYNEVLSGYQLGQVVEW